MTALHSFVQAASKAFLTLLEPLQGSKSEGCAACQQESDLSQFMLVT